VNQELTPHSVWGIYWPGAALFLRHPPHFYSAVYNPLLTAPNCIFTPHYAWATLAARRRLMAATAENLAAFLSATPQNVVN